MWPRTLASGLPAGSLGELFWRVFMSGFELSLQIEAKAYGNLL
jgi:hypothetical protein